MNQLARPFVLFCGLGLVWGFIPLSYGELIWEKQSHRAKAGWDDATVNIAFPFKNSGNKSVKIRSMASSCGCVTLDNGIQKLIKPNEKLKLKATYEVGERTGTQIATIYIETDEGTGKVYTLQIVLELPQVAKMLPGVLSWRQGEQVEDKVMLIRWLGRGKVELQRDVRVASGWNIRISPTVPGKEWKIHARPDTSDHPTMLQVPLIFKDGEKERRTEAILLVHE